MPNPTPSVRKDLNADALFSLVRSIFEKVPDTRQYARNSLVDALMSGLALFSLKDPSLIAFEYRRTDETVKNIYGIEHIPSDTNMRTILDEVNPDHLERAFTKVFAKLQRGKGLEDMVFYEGYYLISNDGTGYFSSEKVHCDQCLTKKIGQERPPSHISFSAPVLYTQTVKKSYRSFLNQLKTQTE